jgi:signal transduction histidine kinase
VNAQDVMLDRPDGGRVCVTVSAGPVDGGGALAMVTDVTERRSAESALRESEQRLENMQGSEAVGRIAGNIAHDFNGAIAEIEGYSHLLLDQLEPGDPLRREAAEISKAASRGVALTRQLLAFSRRGSLTAETLDLTDVVGETKSLLARIVGTEIDLVAGALSDSCTVLADRGQMEQMLVALAVSARESMPAGGRLAVVVEDVDVDEQLATQYAPMPAGPYVLLTVSDTGLGYDEEERARLFVPTASDTNLATVYGIVKQSGGFTWVDSEPGRGATFRIYLPRVDVPAQPTPPSAPPQTVLV